MNIVETFRNIFAIPDLRKRILFTLALLAVYRLGSHVPTPGIDPQALQADEITLAVQVSGKLRGTIRVPAEADQDAIRAAALTEPNVQRFVADKPVRKLIVVPGKLVNIVV